MAAVTTRITSKDVVIQFLPNGVAATHVETLTFAAGVAAGTFKLRVNGEQTASIEVDETTTGNTKINIDAALDALANLTTGEINSAGTFPTITLTASANKFYRIFVEDILLGQTDSAVNGAMAADTDWTKGTGWTIAAGVAACDGTAAGDTDLEQAVLTVGGDYAVQYTIAAYTAGNVAELAGTAQGTNRSATDTHTATFENVLSTAFGVRGDLDFVGDIDNVKLYALTNGTELADPHLTQEATTIGSTLITLSANASSFSWEASAGTVDVTAISEYERLEIDVDSAVSFDISLFEANETWEYAIYEGQSGNIYVYQEGKIVGKKYFAFRALIESFSQDMPDHEKVEIEVSGMRQGEWVFPPHSVYRG